MSQSLMLRKRHARWRIDLAIHEAIQQARDQDAVAACECLIATVRARSTLLAATPIGGYAAWRQLPGVLKALLAISAHRKHWLRDPWEWSARDESPRRQFASLALHLLGTHSVPAFMVNVWFEEPGEEARAHQKLYRHLARGNSIRGADLPLVLTKPMAYHFGEAPDHFTVEQAVRWSQVRGLGGTREFAAAVAATRLGTCFDENDFWTKALKTLIGHPRLDVRLVPGFIALLTVRRHQFRRRLLSVCSKNEFCRVQEEVRGWAERFARRARPPKLAWPATTIPGFDWHEASADPWSMRRWTIRELLDSDALAAEGRAQRHCVATYAAACAQRTTSIWSMQCHGALESHRVLTIEVDPKERCIVTALGYCNRRPHERHVEVLARWAEEAGLSIKPWIVRSARRPLDVDEPAVGVAEPRQ